MFRHDILQEDGRAAIEACVKVSIQGKPELQKYDAQDALKKVLSCFALPLSLRNPHFPKQSSYNIIDIKNIIELWDTIGVMQHTADARHQPIPSHDPREVLSRTFQSPADIIKQSRQRVQIEYDEAMKCIELDHGSGFIIAEGLILTNYHVIESAACNSSYKVVISNAKIKDFTCKVIYFDSLKDLTLLYSADLNLDNIGVSPLRFSEQELLIGVGIFSFGYPISHTGKRALLTHGYTSGIKETFGKPNLVILNCPLNSGNSGGPIMARIGDSISVVGVAAQKHFKSILTLEEESAIEKIKKSMETISMTTNSSSFFTRNRSVLDLLTLKLFDALETHSQFSQSNAIMTSTVIDFIHQANNKISCKSTLKPLLDLLPSSTSLNAPSSPLALAPHLRGLNYVEVCGDGHCLYRAVALYIDQDHQELRNHVANRLESAPETYAEFFTEEAKTLARYAADIRSSKEGTSSFDITLLMRILNRPIIVLGEQGKIVNPESADEFEGDPIFVYYNGYDHYDSLQLNAEYENRPWELLDLLLDDHYKALPHVGPK